jgi:glycosyltransferase involved in cell wall biosynthesis
MPDTEAVMSVVAVAYNSADTVLETLESIRQQGYGAIELIVCDDASRDDTAAVVDGWLREHGHRFVRAQLVRQPTNGGVAGNLAAGLAVATGAWIKGIACDDVLEPSAVEVVMRRAAEAGADWVFTQCAWFTGGEEDARRAPELVTAPEVVALIRTAPMDELTWRVRWSNPFPAAGAFFSRHFLERIGGVDLRFRHMEDWPMWMRGVEAGFRPTWVDEPLVRYRRSPGQLTAVADDRLVPPRLLPDIRLFHQHYVRQHLSVWGRLDRRILHLREWVVLRFLGNRRSALKYTLPLAFLSPAAVWKMLRGQPAQ